MKKLQKISEYESLLGPLIAMCQFPPLLMCKELRKGLLQLIRNARVQVVIRHDTIPPFCNLKNREIHVGWPFCERLWAHLCAYLSIYEWCDKYRSSEALDAYVKGAENASTITLLKWALLGDTSRTRIDWPKNTPQPFAVNSAFQIDAETLIGLTSPAILRNFEGRVTRMFQRAIGWMILHELLHFLARHSAYSESGGLDDQVEAMALEQEADHWATANLIDQPEVQANSREGNLTVLAVIGALVTLASPTLVPFHRKGLGPRFHVENLTRLRRILKSFFTEGDLAWIAASVFLELEFNVQGLPSARGKKFGTDEHYAALFENIQGRVFRT
jgi:hypothetical protein